MEKSDYMPNLGVPELLLILLVVLLLFGAGRVARIGGELGTAIREFRKGIQGDDEETQKADTSTPEKS
jgi:sec-independent protein translocase protein TatA